jgi:hypothetical protein
MLKRLPALVLPSSTHGSFAVRCLVLLALAVALPSLAPAQPRVRPDAAASEGLGADPLGGYDALLRAVVRGNGVDHGALRARLGTLRAFHAWLATHGPGSTPAAFATPSSRKAYWLNAYNATVLRAVAEAPPSMDNVLTWLPDNGFFRTRRWHIDGRQRSLDEIEHDELRAVFRDPRIHMALNCAARSCPPLRPEAYRPDRIDRQLDEQSVRYVNAPANVLVDEGTGTVRVSQLFAWFAEDFAVAVPGRPPSSLRGPLAFVHTFATPSLRARLEATCGRDGARCSLRYAPYDWSLNRAR